MLMPNFVRVYFLLLIVSSIAPAANATIIEGNFKGWIHDVLVSHGDGSILGNPALKSEITASFWYDTELFSYGDPPISAAFLSQQDALFVNFTFANRNFNLSDFPPDWRTSWNDERFYVRVSDRNHYWDESEQFHFTEEVAAVKSDSEDYLTIGATIMPWHGVRKTSLEQKFSLKDELNPVGELNLYLFGLVDGMYHSENLHAYLTEFNIGPRVTTVPEPSGLLLSSLGFLILGCRIYNNSARSKFNY